VNRLLALRRIIAEADVYPRPDDISNEDVKALIDKLKVKGAEFKNVYEA
jgi:hypothetical protein